MILWKKNLILIVTVIIILATPPILIKNAEFSGSDGLAEEQIAKIDPDYKPWFESLLVPKSGEIESLLFALQAAIGAGVVGFILGRMTSVKVKSGADT
ncbi:energy-coupling factor ABC transporter substrate-binding protein [Clostridium sp. BNL1100]|uniref:energy-coupling factor ABC transporter substrate-binding protein n=1 Tax=Clostridium sp. BNL1100 TaxID=755731 RepID=UPI00024A77C3|nr:energy-coupling factor ABC transporter substrate-binding protein [Clostridium sp. BNL1100]AEY65203.1 ABC-type cobalt transport system, periplasmic component [Clostridium sp. BNL1100]